MLETEGGKRMCSSFRTPLLKSVQGGTSDLSWGKEEAHRLQVKIEVQAEALLRWVGAEVE